MVVIKARSVTLCAAVAETLNAAFVRADMWRSVPEPPHTAEAADKFRL